MSYSPSQFVIWDEVSQPGEVVVHVRGELDLNRSHKLAALISRGIRSGGRRLVVDLMECTFIDSSGLAAILRGSRKLNEVGGQLSVACGHPEIRRILALTAIDQTVLVLDRVPRPQPD